MPRKGHKLVVHPVRATTSTGRVACGTICGFSIVIFVTLMNKARQRTFLAAGAAQSRQQETWSGLNRLHPCQKRDAT